MYTCIHNTGIKYQEDLVMKDLIITQYAPTATHLICATPDTANYFMCCIHAPVLVHVGGSYEYKVELAQYRLSGVPATSTISSCCCSLNRMLLDGVQ